MLQGVAIVRTEARVAITGMASVGFDEQHAFVPESGIDAVEIREGADKESRADEQQQGQSDLDRG